MVQEASSRKNKVKGWSQASTAPERCAQRADWVPRARLVVPAGSGPAWGAADRRVAELRAQAALLVETVENRAAQVRRAVPCVSSCALLVTTRIELHCVSVLHIALVPVPVCVQLWQALMRL